MSSKTPPPPPPAPARRFRDALERPGTVIGAGTVIKGELQGGDSVDLAGRLEGPSRVEGFFLVRPGGRVVGPISARDVIVEGDLQGKLTAGGKVEIGATSRVRADVLATLVAIAEGAFFEGQIEMRGGEGEGGQHAFQEKRRRLGPEGMADDPPSAPGPEKK